MGTKWWFVGLLWRTRMKLEVGVPRKRGMRVDECAEALVVLRVSCG